MTPDIAILASLWYQFFRLCGVCVVCVGVGLHVCAHWSQRLTMDAFFYCAPPCLLRQGLSPKPELSNSARLGGQHVGGIPLPLLPSTRSKGTHYHAWFFFIWVLESWTQVLMLVQGALCGTLHLSRPTQAISTADFSMWHWHSPLIGLPDLCGAEFMKNINTHELTEVQTNSSVS